MEDLISVIVPIYKVEKYLEKCILNIVNQTYSNLEIILVDDGSPDNSGKICDEYARKDSRIKVVHKLNGGLSDARNAGIEIATGKYIAFVDSDDYIEEKMISKLYDLLKANDADVSACNICKFYEDKEIELDENEEIVKSYPPEQAILLTILDDSFGNYAWNKLYRSELFSDVRFPFKRRYEDIATIYKILDKANKIVTTTYVGYNYLLGRSGSITTNYNSDVVLDNLKSYTEKYEYLINKYINIKDYIVAEYIRAVTSVFEKIYSFKIEDLYNNELVENSMRRIIKLFKEVDKNILFDVMDCYRISNISMLAYNFEFYKKMIPEFYNSKK